MFRTDRRTKGGGVILLYVNLLTLYNWTSLRLLVFRLCVLYVKLSRIQDSRRRVTEVQLVQMIMMRQCYPCLNLLIILSTRITVLLWVISICLMWISVYSQSAEPPFHLPVKFMIVFLIISGPNMFLTIHVFEQTTAFVLRLGYY